MTREEAITILNMVEANGSLVVQAKDMAIKALKQEDVLDKIIEEVCDIDDEIVLNPDSLYARKTYVRFGKVLEILSKYKAESEE